MKKLLKNTFISHKGNNHKPHLFKEGVVMCLLIVALGIFGIGLGHKALLLRSDSLAAVYAEALVTLTNKDRDKNEIRELVVNPVLEAAAKLKAEDMATKGYFAHYGPDGTAPWDWMKKAGYEYVFAGENLAVNFTDSKSVGRAWMNSPTHRANILDKRYSEIGIATAVGMYKGKEVIFVVQMFGQPKVQAIEYQGASISMVAEAFHTTISNPQSFVLGLYLVLFVVVSAGILATIFSEYRKHHIRHMLFGVALLVTIVVLACMYRNELSQLLII